MKHFKSMTAVFCAALALPGVAQTNAPAYPSKSLKIVVGYTGDGAVDLMARTVGKVMGESMGQPFDAEKQLAAIGQVGKVPVVIAASSTSPYANIQAMVAAAKGKPNSIADGSPGNGSTPHMAIEFFARAAGIDLQHIAYRGGSQAITDVLDGQVPLVAVHALEVQPHVRSGKLKVLAVLSDQRTDVFPDSPTIAESNLGATLQGFEAAVWHGFVAPAATPKDILAKLHAELQKALQNNEVRDRLQASGGEVVAGSPEQFAALIRSERLRYEQLVREAEIQPD